MLGLPIAVVVGLTVVQVLAEFFQQQTGVQLSPVTMLILGAIQLAITTVLGFQKAVVTGVRNLTR